MKAIPVYFITAIVLLFAPVRAQTFEDVDTEFKITLSQRLKPPAGIQADIATTVAYPCVGYTIRTKVSRSQDTIDIKLLGLTRPRPCTKGTGEARGKAFLGNLREGEYQIRIYYRGESDLHDLIVEERRITALPVRSHFTDVKVKGL
jgi:hypothetical protein